MKKKYFRYLDLPFKVEKPNFEDVDFPKIYGDGAGYIVMKKHLPIHERVINFVHGIEGLIVFYIIYLKTVKQNIMTIHNDCASGENKSRISSSSINFSYGDAESKLQFFDIDDYKNVNLIQHDQTKTKVSDAFTHHQGYLEDEPHTDQLIKHKFESVDEKHCKFVTETKLDTTRPTLVNIGEFHRAYNPTNKNRYVIQYKLTWKDRYGEDVSFSDACRLLKDYIRT